MSHKFSSLLSIALLISCGCAQAEIYKWTDAEGQVHYSNTPPPSQQAQTIDEDRVSVVPTTAPSTQTVEAMENRIEKREQAAADERAAIAAKEERALPAEIPRATDGPTYYSPYPYYEEKKNRPNKNPLPQVGPGPYGIGAQYLPPPVKPQRAGEEIKK